MNLTKEYQKILKFLYQQKVKSDYVDIEHLFGTGNKSHKFNKEYQKIVSELKAEGLIEIRNGDHLYNTMTSKNIDRISDGYYYKSIKARVTLKGITLIREKKKRRVQKVIPLLISLGILTVGILNYTGNSNSKVPVLDTSSDIESLIDTKEKANRGKKNLSDTKELSHETLEKTFFPYETMSLFDDSLFITVNTRLEYINQKFELKITRTNDSVRIYSDLSVGELVEYGGYRLKIMKISSNDFNQSKYGVDIFIEKNIFDK